MAVDLCLVFDFGDHAHSGAGGVNIRNEHVPPSAKPAQIATAIAILYAQPTECPQLVAKDGFTGLISQPLAR